MRGSGRLVVAVGAVAAGMLVTHAATAARVATPRETNAIRAAAMANCRATQPSGCEWAGGVVISSVDERYAWAGSRGSSYDTSGVLLRSGGTWRVVRVVGGGASYCSQWLEKVPPRVTRDLFRGGQVAARASRVVRGSLHFGRGRAGRPRLTLLSPSGCAPTGSVQSA